MAYSRNSLFFEFHGKCVALRCGLGIRRIFTTFPRLLAETDHREEVRRDQEGENGCIVSLGSR